MELILYNVQYILVMIRTKNPEYEKNIKSRNIKSEENIKNIKSPSYELS